MCLFKIQKRGKKRKLEFGAAYICCLVSLIAYIGDLRSRRSDEGKTFIVRGTKRKCKIGCDYNLFKRQFYPILSDRIKLLNLNVNIGYLQYVDSHNTEH